MGNVKRKIIDEIIRVEGGHVNDPDDSGGETNFGITVATARAHGYTGAMRDLPRGVAFDIYAARYWDAVRGDELAQLSEIVAEEVVDTAVHMGPKRAATFLQRALNVLNVDGRLYSDLVVDGIIGPVTVGTLAEFLTHRTELVLSRGLNCLQGAAYIELAERRPKDQRFVYGWLKNRVSL